MLGYYWYAYNFYYKIIRDFYKFVSSHIFNFIIIFYRIKLWSMGSYVKWAMKRDKGERKINEAEKKREQDLRQTTAFLALARIAIFAVSCEICHRFAHFIATFVSNNMLHDRVALRTHAPEYMLVRTYPQRKSFIYMRKQERQM